MVTVVYVCYSYVSVYIMEQGLNIFTFTYGTGSVVFLVMSVILLFLTECRNKMKHNVSLCFAISGGFFACIILFSILLKRGVNRLLYGIDMVLNKNPYFTLKDNSGSLLESVLEQFSGMWNVLLCNIRLTTVIALLSIAVYLFICWKKKVGNRERFNINRNTILNIFLAAYWFAYVYLFFSHISINDTISMSEQYLTIPAVFILPFFLIFKKDIPTRLRLFCFFVEISSCCWIFNAGLLALGGYASRCYSLIGVVIAYILLSAYYFSKLVDDKKKYIVYVVYFCSFCLILMGIVSNLYGYVYRDAAFEELNYKISSGVYEGLYTTQERAEGLMETEKKIREITDKNDTVLFMEVVPFAYLMTDAKACAPSTWDISLYSYGFNYDVQYRSYYNIMNCMPDKIIYIDTGRDDHLSIDEPEYHFNEFVNKNYTLNIRTDDIYFPIRMYERKMTKRK